MTTAPLTEGKKPIACTLSPVDANDQLAQWSELRQLARKTERLAHGVAMTFAESEHDAVLDVAKREATCCAFLSFATGVSDGELRLEITSAQSDAWPVIATLSGTEQQ